MALINKDNVDRFSGLKFDKDELWFLDYDPSKTISREISGIIDRKMIEELMYLGYDTMKDKLVSLDFDSIEDIKEKSDQF